jgi:hypothetical protein
MEDIRETDVLFDRLHDAIAAGHRRDLRFRELHKCAALLEMHVAEEPPDLLVIDAVENLIGLLARLRGLPHDRVAPLAQALLDIKKYVSQSPAPPG